MARDILAGTPASPASTPSSALPAGHPATAAPTPTPAATAGQEQRDALAGALPAWDLLPASPFVRRVK